jgi:hypothetical protein
MTSLEPRRVARAALTTICERDDDWSVLVAGSAGVS